MDWPQMFFAAIGFVTGVGAAVTGLQLKLKKRKPDLCLLQRIQDGVIILDSHRRIVGYNTSAQALLRCDLDCNNRPLAECWAYQPFPASILQDRRSELRIETPRASIYQFEKTEFDSFILLVFRDITARCKKEDGNAGQQEKQSDLVQEVCERIEASDVSEDAKGAVIAHMTHEIRSPLNGIIGFSELIQESVNDPKILHYAKLIEDTGHHINQVMDDILDISLLEEGALALHPQPTDPAKLIMNVTALFQWQLSRKGIVCSIRARNSELPHVLIDPVRLRQVLFNLIGNAVKFTTRGSIIVDLTWEEDESGETGTLQYEVADTGVGISQENLARIFLPFYVAGDSEHTGSGLGLSICDRLVREMGGEIGVRSIPGEGSVFSLRFPGIAVHHDESAIMLDDLESTENASFRTVAIESGQRPHENVIEEAAIAVEKPWRPRVVESGIPIWQRGFPAEIGEWASRMSEQSRGMGDDRMADALQDLADAASQFDVVRLNECWRQVEVI
ncbi:MAG: sensor histidine kinase [Spirochaeta sp.]